MPFIVTSRNTSNRQPQGLVQLNGANQLTYGLATGAVASSRFTLNTAGRPLYLYGKVGQTPSGLSANDSAGFECRPVAAIGYPQTLAVVAHVNALPASDFSNIATSNSGPQIFYLGLRTTGVPYATSYTSAFAPVTVDAGAVTAGRSCVIAGIHTSNTVSVYSQNASATSSTFTPWANPTGLSITMSGNASVQALMVLAWARALSLSEIAALSNNPWQIFRPVRPVSYSLPLTLYSAIDETSPDTSDYIQTTAPSNSYTFTAAAAIATPQSGTNIDLRFQADGVYGNEKLTFDVYAGTATVKSYTTSFLPTTPTTQTVSITPADYSGVTFPWTPSVKVTSSGVDIGKFAAFLPQRWKSQPQQQVQIDWRNPLTLGLVEAWTGSQPTRTLVRGYSTVAPPLQVNRDTGIGTKFVVSASTAFAIGVADNLFPDNQRATLAFLKLNNDTTARQAVHLGYFTGTGDADRVSAHLPWDDGNSYWDFGNPTAGSGRVFTATGSKTTALETWVLTAGPQFGRVMYRNGRAIVSDGAAKASRTSTGSVLFRLASAKDTTASDNFSIGLLLILSKEWGQQEVREFNLNPWQIFAPVRELFYFA